MTIQDLNKISDGLWKKAFDCAVKCLDNFVENDGEENELKIVDYKLEKDKQSLVFWSPNSKTCFIRITYKILTGETESVPIGYYSLDVNLEQEFIEDWLVFDDRRLK